ncbi:unnamed protein product [Umbelopsis vinacea]|jgi:hypothetical protein
MDILSNKEYDEEYKSKMQEIMDRAAKIALALKDGDETRPMKLRRSLSTSSSRKRHPNRQDFEDYEVSAQSDEERLQRRPSRRRSLSRRRKSNLDSSEWKISRQNPMGYENLYQQQILPVSSHHHHLMDKGASIFDPYPYGHYAIPAYPPYWTGVSHQAESPYLDEPTMMGYFGHPGLMHSAAMLQPPPPPPTDFVTQEFSEIYNIHPSSTHHPHPPLAMPPMHPMHAMIMENGSVSSPMLHPAILSHHMQMDSGMDPTREANHLSDNEISPSQMLSARLSMRQSLPMMGTMETKWCFRTVSEELGEQWTAFDDNNQMLIQESGPNDSTAYEIMDSHIERGRKKIMVLPHRQYCFYHLHGQMIKLPISLQNMTASPMATMSTGTP